MEITVRQTAFTSGIYSKDIVGRTDVEGYRKAVEISRNMVLHMHGPASNRGGFEYVCEVKDSSKKVRLLPFQFNTTQSYVIETGHNYLRYIKDDGQIVYPVGHASAGQIVETATGYAEADLFRLKYVQSADIFFIDHPTYPPNELSRTDHHLWTLNQTTFTPSVSAPVISCTHTGSTYNHTVTAVSETGEESLISNVKTTDVNPGAVLSWSAITNAVSYKIYTKRSTETNYGLWGTTTALSWNIPSSYSPTAPDYTKQPPTIARNPFNGANNYPSVGAFYQQRMLHAATITLPTSILASRTGSFRNFNISSPLQEDDSYTKVINAQEVNEIRWMVPLRELVVGTSGGEWVVSPDGTTGIVSPTKGFAKPQSYYGSAHIRPIVVGNTILFVEGSGNVVRDLLYTLDKDGYDGNNLCVFVPELFENRVIVDWAFQQHPDSTLWCVTDDGLLLALTYYREAGGGVLFGWHQHDTDGLFESVCCVTTNAGVDEIYVVVKRTINGQTKRYIERMKKRLPSADLEDAFFVDCGKTYTGSPATTISGLSHLEGKTVSILADGVPVTGKTVTSGSITLDTAASKVTVGLPYKWVLKTLDLEAQGQNVPTIQNRPRQVKSVHVQFKKTSACKVGPDETSVVDMEFTEGEMFTGGKEVNIDSSDWESSSVYLEGELPVPVTVLAITAKIEVS